MKVDELTKLSVLANFNAVWELHDEEGLMHGGLAGPAVRRVA